MSLEATKDTEAVLEKTLGGLSLDGASKKDGSVVKTDEPEEPKEPKKEEPKEASKEEKEASKEEPAIDSSLIESSYDVQVKLADLQADPNSPLYSVKSFEELGLSPELLKGLNMMKFYKPSKIQEKALPLLLHKPPQNLIGQSQSGTGKTGAFTLTMLSAVDPKLNEIQAICVAPTRELAIQTAEVARTMAKYTDIKVDVVVPLNDTPKVSDRREREKALRAGQKVVYDVTAPVVVATPGTLLSWSTNKRLDLSHVKLLVLDEADNMLDIAGLGSQVIKLRKILKKDIQTVLFSATFPDHVYNFAKKIVPNANEIRLKSNELNVSGITQLYMDCDNQTDKLEKLVQLYNVMTIASSIIFVESRVTAENLYKEMTKRGHKVSILHGGLEPDDRDRLMNDFRTGKSKVLITTNVLARGVDVASVSVVINYDLPTDEKGKPDPSTYLHRIGRTGRFGRVGVSISLVHDKKSFDILQSIMDYFSGSVTLEKLPNDDWPEVEEIVRKAIRN